MKHHGSHHGHPRRPNIGITPDIGTSTGAYPASRYELKTAYVEAVVRGGGLPFILPYIEERPLLEALLDRISALVVTGGAFDIPPEAYGESAGEGMGVTKPGRTSFETALIKEALSRNMPVLGVCGGMQLLNVVLGGTLHQDIRRELPQAREHEQPHDRAQPHHPVEVKDGTVLATVLGKGQLMVNSTHHQAVKKAGDKLVISAVAPDGVVEAIEGPDYAFALGVQWHPETLIDSVPVHLGLYRSLIAKARDYRR